MNGPSRVCSRTAAEVTDQLLSRSFHAKFQIGIIKASSVCWSESGGSKPEKFSPPYFYLQGLQLQGKPSLIKAPEFTEAPDLPACDPP